MKTLTLAVIFYAFTGVVSVAKITEKQKRFVAEYLVDLNATQAAIRAGYSPKTANEQGARLLTKVSVQEHLQKQQAKLRNKLEITQERVIEELAAIAFANGTDFVTVTSSGLLHIKPTSQVDKQKLPAIAGIKYGANLGVEIKLHDKVRALELLGKHLGVFDSKGGSGEQENNIFDVIAQSTREEISTDDIPEIEPPAKPGDDVVE